MQKHNNKSQTFLFNVKICQKNKIIYKSLKVFYDISNMFR